MSGRGGARPGAGRKPGAQKNQLSPHVIKNIQGRIQAERLIKRLQDHVNSPDGNMQPSAVTAALGLLRKVLPDLAAIEHSGQIETKPASQMTDDELAAIAARGRAGADEAPVDPKVIH